MADDSNDTASFSLEILAVIRAAQNAHGLRHGDHRRYRQYCARRLRRLRKAKDFRFMLAAKHSRVFNKEVRSWRRRISRTSGISWSSS